MGLLAGYATHRGVVGGRQTGAWLGREGSARTVVCGPILSLVLVGLRGRLTPYSGPNPPYPPSPWGGFVFPGSSGSAAAARRRFCASWGWPAIGCERVFGGADRVSVSNRLTRC